MAQRPRLDPAIFNLPVEKMKSGYYSDKYFVRTRDILLNDGSRPRVTMQVFGKTHAFLGGVDEAIAILKLCASEWSDLEVHALFDGDEVDPWETVMLIEGPYDAFAHLETLYLGVLARRTRVGTNTRRVVEAAAPKQIMFFPARHDHWLVQTGDGYAAHIAGAIGVSTDAQASWWGSEGVGTVPHAMIAAYGGDTVRA
ncbi:MAG: quinolinate phosphoribosyl transferase, partial [Gemmatimonadales bacterium]